MLRWGIVGSSSSHCLDLQFHDLLIGPVGVNVVTVVEYPAAGSSCVCWPPFLERDPACGRMEDCDELVLQLLLVAAVGDRLAADPVVPAVAFGLLSPRSLFFLLWLSLIHI